MDERAAAVSLRSLFEAAAQILKNLLFPLLHFRRIGL
jgi:hypothetical protein